MTCDDCGRELEPAIAGLPFAYTNGEHVSCAYCVGTAFVLLMIDAWSTLS